LEAAAGSGREKLPLFPNFRVGRNIKQLKHFAAAEPQVQFKTGAKKGMLKVVNFETFQEFLRLTR
jgi:hypothetical protein